MPRSWREREGFEKERKRERVERERKGEIKREKKGEKERGSGEARKGRRDKG